MRIVFYRRVKLEGVYNIKCFTPFFFFFNFRKQSHFVNQSPVPTHVYVLHVLVVNITSPLS